MTDFFSCLAFLRLVAMIIDSSLCERALQCSRNGLRLPISDHELGALRQQAAYAEVGRRMLGNFARIMTQTVYEVKP